MHKAAPDTHLDWSLTWIIGTGASVADLDVGRISSGVLLGLNEATFRLPCHAFFSLDQGWTWSIRARLEAFAGERHLCVRRARRARFEGRGIKLWERTYDGAPTLVRGKIDGGARGVPATSGYAGLNLAAQMGAKRIILLGYDFGSQYRYFFQHQPGPFKPTNVPAALQSFRRVAPWYREHGIEIVNANPNSAIDAFSKISLAEAYELKGAAA